MSETEAAPPRPPGPRTSSAAMIRTLALVATVCGILIVSAYEGTLEAVTANKRIALERAVFKVIPEATEMQVLQVGPDGIQPESAMPAGGAVRFYAAYGRDGNLAGIAAEAAAYGYADAVRVLFAYSPDEQAITGLGVIAMRETPGIGDKIITDANFLRNFEFLDVRLNAEMTGLANAIKVVKHGTKKNPWEIDAIAGATVTSKAVGKGISDSARKLLPLLVPNLDMIRSK